MNDVRNEKGQFESLQLSPEEKLARRKANVAAWRARNRERLKAYSAKSRTKYGAKYEQKRKDWVDANREKVRTYQRGYRRKRAGLPEPTREKPGNCECCGKPPNGKGCMHLDHCHRTGEFRGWLCFQCNSGIGALGDNVAGLARAIVYLSRSEK